MNSKYNKKPFKKYLTTIFLILILTVVILYVQALLTIPNELLIIIGEENTCNFKFPVLVGLSPDKKANLLLNGSSISTNGIKLNLMNPFTLRSDSTEQYNLNLKLFGVVPLKTLTVKSVPNKYIIPCGNTVGVKVYTDGVLVVGTSEIHGDDGKYHEPFRGAEIKPGDYIIEMNNKKVQSISDVVDIMNSNNGSPCILKIRREDNISTAVIHPVKDNRDNRYRMGIWLRDSTAGIGTMTFYDPETGAFGALGHGITDVDTGKLMVISKGEVLNSNVVSVKKGEKGSPGEIRGVLMDNGGNGKIGNVYENCECGIFGLAHVNKFLPTGSKSLPIALRAQIKEGPAYLISNISGNTTDTYSVEIQKIFKNSTNSSKSMVIKITDDRLINYTGGIVQGMSGSPIIQNGRIIGAVTHVLVNDPTKGYAVFIEWMIQKANNIHSLSVLKNAS